LGGFESFPGAFVEQLYDRLHIWNCDGSDGDFAADQ
jgi:hypothetical protein